MSATDKQTATLVRKLDVEAAVAARLIAAGLHTTKLARQASVLTLTAIEGIDASKAAAIRSGGQ